MAEIRKLIVAPKMTEQEALSMVGSFVTEESINFLIQEDCDVYTDDGQPLLFLRKNVVSFALAKQAYESLRIAAVATDNRGNSAEGGSIVKDKKTLRCKLVNSGIIGYYDRYIRIPYCRKTAFNDKHLKKFKAAYPYIKLVDQTLKEVVPERYQKQLNMINKTHPDFYIKDTVFTTVTVNKNYRTALHVDKGDYKLGFGTLSVLAAGKYTGAYTVMPRFGIAVDCRSRDIACFDVHQVHGNTEFKGAHYERIAVVCYYRENMYKCGSAAQELARAKNRKLGEKLY